MLRNKRSQCIARWGQVGRTGANDGAGLAWLGEIDLRVRRGQDRVGGADDGTNLRHDDSSGGR